jgi:acyl dehydratase
MKAEERTFEELAVGQSVSFEKEVNVEDIVDFGRLSGDLNPLHLDADYASEQGFSRPVVHGMFLGALVSQLVGMRLPGRRALLVKETLEFRKPVLAGERVIVSGEIVGKSQSTKIVELAVRVVVGGMIATSGEVFVKVLD